jgi:hypothetical protein
MPKRCIFFTSHEVFFVCRLGTKDATFYAESKPEDGVREDHNNDTISQFNSIRRSGSNDLDVILPGVWLAIEHYTSRQLSYSFGALNAFSGIMSIAGNMFGLTFIYGLLEQSFDAALLWFPQVASSKRNPDVPSWSWAGWIGEVAFQFNKQEVRTEIKISREQKTGKRPAELVARSHGGIMAQPKILCFRTTIVKASQFPLNLEEGDHQIRTTDGLWCGIFWGAEMDHFVLDIKSDEASFVLLSRSNLEGGPYYYALDQPYLLRGQTLEYPQCSTCRTKRRIL